MLHVPSLGGDGCHNVICVPNFPWHVGFPIFHGAGVLNIAAFALAQEDLDTRCDQAGCMAHLLHPWQTQRLEKSCQVVSFSRQMLFVLATTSGVVKN
jgi:hypothetical protein